MSEHTTSYRRFIAWLTREEHRRRARALREDINRAFTEHPADTGETYWQHLWFTSKMSARLLYTMTVLIIHGLFPFLLMRAASMQIEEVYRIMKSRIPKSRRDAIDADFDYTV
ncbi:MAG: DUF6356 family protein [Pseudomonadota bacterium]